jgi:hypothetical protein
MKHEFDTYNMQAEQAFWKTFDAKTGWPVEFDHWDQEIYNYLIRGWQPGSFHTALFAGDLFGAAQHSHHFNQWEGIVQVAKWVLNVAPPESKGSYENIEKWCKLSDAERQTILLRCGLLYTDREVTWKILKT